LHEERVKGAVDLVVNRAIDLLARLDGGVDELGIVGLLGSGENQRGVGGRILGLVLVNGSKVTRVANDDLREGACQLGSSRMVDCLCRETHTVPEDLSWSRELDMILEMVRRCC